MITSLLNIETKHNKKVLWRINKTFQYLVGFRIARCRPEMVSSFTKVKPKTNKNKSRNEIMSLEYHRPCHRLVLSRLPCCLPCHQYHPPFRLPSCPPPSYLHPCLKNRLFPHPCHPCHIFVIVSSYLSCLLS